VTEPRGPGGGRSIRGTTPPPTGPMIDPHGEVTDVISDVPELSADEVERRIGARERARRRRAAAVPAGRIRVAPANRRVVLWRDSATILIFVILALLAARYLLPGNTGIASATETPGTSAILVGSLPAQTGLTFSAPPTLGNVVNPSLGLDATPTPVPIITLPPPTPTPVPTPTLAPGATPKITPRPSHTPVPTHTPAPTPTAPHASLATPTCDTPGGNSITFDGSGSTAGSAGGPLIYEWNFDEGVGFVPGTAMISHTFTSGTYGVILKVTDASGKSDVTSPVSVTLPC
jgi:hypothetical protein